MSYNGDKMGGYAARREKKRWIDLAKKKKRYLLVSEHAEETRSKRRS